MCLAGCSLADNDCTRLLHVQSALHASHSLSCMQRALYQFTQKRHAHLLMGVTAHVLSSLQGALY